MSMMCKQIMFVLWRTKSHCVMNMKPTKINNQKIVLSLNPRHETKELGESLIKYTFCDPCQQKCKVVINQTLTY
jgi:hypothetical protein